jgi:hypothetical protein
MQNTKEAISTELANIDKALRRSAVSAKKLSERDGTPYVVYRDSNTGRFLTTSETDKKK